MRRKKESRPPTDRISQLETKTCGQTQHPQWQHSAKFSKWHQHPPALQSANHPPSPGSLRVHGHTPPGSARWTGGVSYRWPCNLLLRTAPASRLLSEPATPHRTRTAGERAGGEHSPAPPGKAPSPAASPPARGYQSGPRPSTARGKARDRLQEATAAEREFPAAGGTKASGHGPAGRTFPGRRFPGPAARAGPGRARATAGASPVAAVGSARRDAVDVDIGFHAEDGLVLQLSRRHLGREPAAARRGTGA